MTDRQLAVVAGIFAVFLTACDALFHVRTDTLVYHWEPQVWDQTIIVPVTFFLAAIAMLDISRRVRPVAPAPAGTRRVAVSLGVVTVVYGASGLVEPDLSAAFALALLAAWTVRVAVRRQRPPALVACVVIAVGGVLAEAALSAIGEFDYVAPDLLGVPWWLFPLYLHGALAAADVVALVQAKEPVHATT
ncbi:hypothetical protein [Aeromicrobium sp. NPDC092404]|uniref:hypothetical protein n=1 Tax=Aeromicrobium sp. NPDC092404 TaxID=3154976 RepID=UPI00341AF678